MTAPGTGKEIISKIEDMIKQTQWNIILAIVLQKTVPECANIL